MMDPNSQQVIAPPHRIPQEPPLGHKREVRTPPKTATLLLREGAYAHDGRDAVIAVEGV